jgi:hypothetical protein
MAIMQILKTQDLPANDTIKGKISQEACTSLPLKEKGSIQGHFPYVDCSKYLKKDLVHKHSQNLP